MKALVLLNLGTPDAPTPLRVRAYLHEFLMDPFVIDIPWPARIALVYGLISPFRPAKTAAAYQKVWTETGSPLLNFHLELTEKVAREMGSDWKVVPAMRYGKPSIRAAVESLKGTKWDEIVIFPLYPQYSLAATESSLVEFDRWIKKLLPDETTRAAKPFYAAQEFLDSFKRVIEESLRNFPHDHLIFSFHGLPERQVKRTDTTGACCLASENCCNEIVGANRNCYRAQCFVTAHELARRLGIPPAKYSISFQSRLGRTPWIRPYTDILLQELPGRGVKRVAVACPAFVADCLETLEEIAIRGREDFKKWGGEELKLIPSLNANDFWVKSVASLARGNP